MFLTTTTDIVIWLVLGNICLSNQMSLNSVSFSEYVSKGLQLNLKPLHNCLIQINNHRTIDIAELPFPVILRHRDTSQQSSHNKLKLIREEYYPKFIAQLPNKTAVVDILGNVYGYNISGEYVTRIQNNDSIFDCRISKYLHGGPDELADSVDFNNVVYGQCSKINLVSFTFNSRPWKCEAHVELLPSSRLTPTDWTTSSFWFWQQRNDSKGPSHYRNDNVAYFAMTQANLPRFQISVTLRPIGSDPAIEHWLRYIRRERQWYFGNLNVILHIQLVFPHDFTQTAISLLVPHNSWYVSLDVNRPMFLNMTFRNIAKQLGETLIEESINLAVTYLEPVLQIRISKYSRASKQLFHALSTATLDQLSRFRLDEIWRNIFQNTFMCSYCLVINSNRSSGTGRGILFLMSELRPVSNITIQSPFTTDKFRFVSCGRSTETSFVFRYIGFQFRSSQLDVDRLGYDDNCTVGYLSSSMDEYIDDFRKSGKTVRDKLIECIIACYKLLLEQGNPFSNGTVNN